MSISKIFRRLYSTKFGFQYYDTVRNGDITATDKGLRFESHTQKGKSPVDWTSRKCEVKLPYFNSTRGTKIFKFKFTVDKWIDYGTERDSGTFGGGKWRGGYAIITQLWNSKAAPRTHLTVQRKRKPDGTLYEDKLNVFVQNKDHTGKLTTYHTFETEVGRENDIVHIVESNGRQQTYSVIFNGEEYTTPPLNALYSRTALQFGLYWSGNIYKSLVRNGNLDRAIGRGMVARFEDMEFIDV